MFLATSFKDSEYYLHFPSLVFSFQSALQHISHKTQVQKINQRITNIYRKNKTYTEILYYDLNDMARDWKASARLPSLFNSRLTT
jgi:hypothetical protein